MTTIAVVVSDHALLRWLQRVEGFDVDAVRRRIETAVGAAPLIGAPFVTHDGFSIILDGNAVVTVLDRTQHPKVSRAGKAKYHRRDG